MADGPASKAQVVVARAECAIGVAVVRIAEALNRKNVLAIISSDYRARDVYAALQGAVPKAEIVFFPPVTHCPATPNLPRPQTLACALRR